MKKRLLALTMAVLMSVTICNVNGFAEETNQNLEVTVDKSGEILQSEPTNEGILSSGDLLPDSDAVDSEEEQESITAQSDDEDTLVESELTENSHYLSTAEYDHAHDAEIVNAVKNMETSLDVSSWDGITVSNYSEIVSYVINTHPELYYFYQYGYSHYQGSEKVIKLNFVYDTELASQKETFNQALATAKAELDTQITSSMTDLEKALVVHDYLAATVAYDYTNYLNYVNGISSVPRADYNMYGVLVNHSAVCQGYAETFYYFMNLYGVPCDVISSTNANHAWNAIKLDGKWYQVDATWDDPTWDLYGRVSHTYFLLSEDSLLSKCSNRSDFVGMLNTDSASFANSDTQYESGHFWNNTSARTYYYNGQWYYLSNNALCSCNYSSESSQSLVNVSDKWYAWNSSSSYYSGSYSKMYGSGNKIYYSTPKAIYIYNIDANAKHVYYTPDTSTGYIYGFGVTNGVMGYALETSPNSSGDETILPITDSNADDSAHIAVTDAAVAATATTTGLTEGSHCSVCGKVLVAQETIPVVNVDHHYQNPVFDWSADGKTCKVTYTCANDASHTVTYDCDVTAAVTKAATCTAKGTTTYTATYGSDKATKDVDDIPALGHKEKAVTIYKAGYKITSTCENCGDVISKEPATSVMQDENGTWRYYVNGERQDNYTGFADNQYGTWYIKEGKVAWGTGGSKPTTGTIIYGTVNGKSAWYLVCNAKVTYATTVASNSYGWWYVKNGVVDFSYTGIKNNDYGWWRIVKGKVDFNCNTVEQNEYGWWKLKGGKVDFSCNTVERNANGWWKLKGGKVDFSYTGVANNTYGWWRVEKGKVNFGFTGIASNAYGSWYCKGGKVQFGYTGKVIDNGKTYNVKNGKVQ